MIKRKKMMCLIYVFVMAMLCTCCNSETMGEYVNITEIKKQIEITQLNIDVDSFEYDDKSKNVTTSPFTIDSDYIYMFSGPNIKINLKSGRVQFWCNVPGCVHDELTSMGCMSHVSYNSPIATADGIYYSYEDNVCLFDGEKETIILKNTNYTSFEEEVYPDNRECIGGLVIKDKLLYVVCPTYFFIYNMVTKEISEPVKISTNIILSFCVTDEYICYSTESMELFIYDLETKEITKLYDKVGQVRERDGKFYYIKWDGETPVLYRTESDGSNPQKLIEDCYVNYQITDSGIYYQSYKTKSCYFYLFDKNSSAKLALNSDSDEDYIPNYHYIISTGSIDCVFVYDDRNGLVTVIKDGETEGKTIELGDRYSPTWG